MFVKNLQKKDIKLRSFEGYEFVIPPGVSSIWDKAGDHLLKNIYKIESRGGNDKFGFNNGSGLPPLQEASREEWVKDGRHYTEVKRFQVDAKLVPRKQLITLAQKRGVSVEKLTEYSNDDNISGVEIAETINNLPVPDEIRYSDQEINENQPV